MGAFRSLRPHAVAIFSAVMLLGACSELSDKDYFKNIETTVNSDELVVVDMSSEEYLSKEPEYSSINELFKSHGIFTALEQKNQLGTSREGG